MSRRQRNLVLLLSLLTGMVMLMWHAGTNNLSNELSSKHREGFLGGVWDGNGGKWSLFQLPDKQDNSEDGEDDDDNQEGDGGGDIASESKTVILMWTKYYSVKDEATMRSILSGRKWDPECCAQEDVVVTLDRNMLPRATAVVFFHYFGNLEKKDLPPIRLPGQIWVLFGKESPVHSHTLRQFPDMFNWTMTYRRDSDIWAPYGVRVPLEEKIPLESPILMPGNIPLDHWIGNKTDLFAGVISHCPTRSKREQLIVALRNSSLSVHIYGACGNHSICPRTRPSCDHALMWQNMGARYKFYFAAENALCVDYITEKFWRTLERGMVPVVYGGANYTAVAPPHSFIDVRDFKSAQELAEYLEQLDNDPEEYAKYFEWRREYTVNLLDGWAGWCQLCRVSQQYRSSLQGEDIGDGMEGIPLEKTYHILSDWWQKEKIGSKNGACTGPPFPLPPRPSRKPKNEKA